jgi:V/A-type H+/Na+-transporting ATPase subunit I
MIVPMIKYSLLIYHKDYDKLVNELGNIGIFHIIEKYEGQDIGVKKLERLIKEIEELVVFLKEFRSNNPLASTHKDTYIAEELIEIIKGLRKQLEECYVNNSILSKEIEKLQPWAKLTRDYLSQLSANDKEPHCFISHTNHFN